MVENPASDSLIYRQHMRRGIAVCTMIGSRFPNWVRNCLMQEPVMADFLAGCREVIEHAREDGGQ